MPQTLRISTFSLALVTTALEVPPQIYIHYFLFEIFKISALCHGQVKAALTFCLRIPDGYFVSGTFGDLYFHSQGSGDSHFGISTSGLCHSLSAVPHSPTVTSLSFPGQNSVSIKETNAVVPLADCHSPIVSMKEG